MGILLLHRRTGSAFPDSWLSQFAHWQTCLREILLVPNQSQMGFDAYECFEEEAAIRFLVEICSGLHSPVLGETEVFGQFRARFKNFQHQDPEFQADVRQFTRRVIECTKRVRESCVKGGTSSSYGSLTRRFTKGYSSASFLGAGRLAAEIIPWLDHFRVEVHARDFTKAGLVAAKHKTAQLKNLSESPNGDVAIIVAPLEAKAIEEWFSKQKPKLVLDLRRDSESDALASHSAEKIITLQSFFSELEQNETKRTSLLSDARQLLDRLLQQRERVEIRPFGWEDVCA